MYQYLERKTRVKDEYNEIAKNRFYQILLSCIKIIFLFFINNQCQSIKLLKLDSLVDESGDNALIVNFLINYINESYIKTRILMTTNESCSIPRHELSFGKLIQF